MLLFLTTVFYIWCMIGVICIMMTSDINEVCDFDKFTLPQKIFTIFMAGPPVWIFGICILICLFMYTTYMKVFNLLGNYDIKLKEK